MWPSPVDGHTPIRVFKTRPFLGLLVLKFSPPPYSLSDGNSVEFVESSNGRAFERLMKIHLITRIVALLLVLCLIADRATASAFQESALPGWHTVERFDEEALTLSLVFPLHSTLTKSAITIRQALASPLLHQPSAPVVHGSSNLHSLVLAGIVGAVLGIGFMAYLWNRRASKMTVISTEVGASRNASAKKDIWDILLEAFFDKPRLMRLKLERWIVQATVTLFFPTAIVVFGSARIEEGHPYYKFGGEIGTELAIVDIPPRSGAGPGLMEAPLRAFVEFVAQKSLFGRWFSKKTQGLRILLPFEAGINPYVQRKIEIKHFMPRKIGLHENTDGSIILPGGFGTADEFFEVARRFRNMILADPLMDTPQAYWPPVLKVLKRKLRQAKVSIPTNFPKVTNNAKAAVSYIIEQSKNRPPYHNTRKAIRQANKELAAGLQKIAARRHGVAIFGEIKAKSPAAPLAQKIITRLVDLGIPVTIASQKLVPLVKEWGLDEGVRYTLYDPNADSEVTLDKHDIRHIITSDMSVHQVLVSKDSGFVILPGAFETLGLAFDIATITQCKKLLPARPIVLAWLEFWGDIKSIWMEKMLSTDPPMISPKDPEIIPIANSVEETISLLNLKLPSSGETSMFYGAAVSVVDRHDQALDVLKTMKCPPGGCLVVNFDADRDWFSFLPVGNWLLRGWWQSLVHKDSWKFWMRPHFMKRNWGLNKTELAARLQQHVLMDRPIVVSIDFDYFSAVVHRLNGKGVWEDYALGHPSPIQIRDEIQDIADFFNTYQIPVAQVILSRSFHPDDPEHNFLAPEADQGFVSMLETVIQKIFAGVQPSVTRTSAFSRRFA